MYWSRVVLAALALAALATPAAAQSRARVFDVKLGTPASELPVDEWVEPSCGTNGGPPSVRLESFADFERCRPEPDTGLREVWFIYDDEWEYVARAYGDPMEIQSFSANVFYAQPVITSVLIDGDGLVQGFRVISDPRAPVNTRRQAYGLAPIFRSLVSGAPWTCSDLPRDAREDPVEGKFVKSSCTLISNNRIARIEGRLLRKAGQAAHDIPGMTDRAEGDFESLARLEVFSRAAVAAAPCCSELASKG